jgi:hypothetical protein
MPQHTSTKTSGNGLIVSTVINTETNIRTITVTTPDGKTASTTEGGNFNGNFTRPSNASISGLINNLEAQGATDLNLTDVGSAVRASNQDAVRQKEKTQPPAVDTLPPSPPDIPPPSTVLGPSTVVTQSTTENNTVLQSTTTVVVETSTVLNANAVITQSSTVIDSAPLTTEEAEARTSEQVTVDTDIATNESLSSRSTAEKYENSEIVDLTDPNAPDGGYERSAVPYGQRDPGVPAGAQRAVSGAPSIIFTDIKGNKGNKDLRVKIRVPPKYLSGLASPLINFQGILFPYTPIISYEVKADYASTTPMHSNFAQYFYKNSSVSPITIQGKFSVENSRDAEIYIATMHLLRTLTRMRYGGATSGDADSGAPPPVCRLDGHGEMMLINTPVVIASYRVDFQDSIDYFTYKGKTGTGNQDYGPTSVPTVSTISVICNPVYSRNEMQKFSVTGYLNNSSFRKQGYI